MARDNGVPLRMAVIEALKADAAVAAIVGARVYSEEPPADPTWPFIRYGFAINTQASVSGSDGTDTRVTIHGFAKGSPTTDGPTAIGALGKAIAEALDGNVTSAPPASVVEFFWAGSNTLRDTDEANAYHAVVEFDALVLEPIS